ncbi:hypothetical protein [Bradyrhizobium sp. LB12.1]|uniref:hypothetical protein n=1 Tax=unclassified Bradyrhizobium TaxID=2631580 RepID=UPI003393C6B1
MIDTIAMIGSPAARGATASAGWRACLAAMAGDADANATIAAKVAIPGGPQRRIVMVDCVVVSRFFMPSSVEMPVRCAVTCQIAIFTLRNRSRLTFRLWRDSARSGDKISHIGRLAQAEGRRAAVAGPKLAV